MRLVRPATATLACAMLLSAGAVGAAPASDFYKGRTINVIIGYSAGGGYDLYARVLAQHMGKHIPGNPNVDIDLIQKAWASKRDPLFLPGNFNNRILIDACIPYEMKLKKTFPTVVDVSGDLRGRLRAKFPHIFPPM